MKSCNFSRHLLSLVDIKSQNNTSLSDVNRFHNLNKCTCNVNYNKFFLIYAVTLLDPHASQTKHTTKVYSLPVCDITCVDDPMYQEKQFTHYKYCYLLYLKKMGHLILGLDLKQYKNSKGWFPLQYHTKIVLY